MYPGYQMKMVEKKILSDLPKKIEQLKPINALKKQHVTQFLRDKGIECQFVYLTPSSDDVMFVPKNADRKKLLEALQAQSKNKDIINQSFTPTAFLCQLLGVLIPFEKDTINDKRNKISPNTAKLEGAQGKSCQFKFPLLLQKDARKLHHYLTTRLLDALNPKNVENVEKLFEPKEWLSWQNFLATLPELPDDISKDYDRYMRKFSDKYGEHFGLFYIHPSKKTRGLFERVMLDDFEKFFNKIQSIVEKNKTLLVGYPCAYYQNDYFAKEYSKNLKNYLEGIEPFINALQLLQQAVVVRFDNLCEMLALPISEGGYGEEATTRVGNPIKWGQQQIAIPLELDIPKMPFSESDTLLVLDCGEAMKGQLSALQGENGLQKILTARAKEPNHFLTLVTFQELYATGRRRGKLKSSAVVKVRNAERIPLTLQTLPEIMTYIQALTAEGASPGLEGLRLAINTLKQRVQNPEDDKKTALDSASMGSLSTTASLPIMRGEPTTDLGVITQRISSSEKTAEMLPTMAGSPIVGNDAFSAGSRMGHATNAGAELEKKKVSDQPVMPRSNARVLLVTAGVWKEAVNSIRDESRGRSSKEELIFDAALFPQILADLREIFKSSVHLPIDILGMSLDPEGAPQQLLREIAAIAGEGSQMLFVNTKEIGIALDDLLSPRPFRLLESLSATYVVNRQRVLTDPLMPCLTNRVHDAEYLFPPKEILEVALKQKENMGVEITITYDDKTTAVRRHLITATSCQAVIDQDNSVSQYDKRKVVEAWIKKQMFEQGVARLSHVNLLSGFEQFEMYIKIFHDAQLHSEKALIHSVLQSKMEECSGDWIRVKSHEYAKLPEGASFDKQNPLVQFEALTQVQAEVSNFGLNQSAETLRFRLTTLWCEANVLKSSKLLGKHIQSYKDFDWQTPEHCIEVLEKVLALAEQQAQNKDIESLKSQLGVQGKRWARNFVADETWQQIKMVRRYVQELFNENPFVEFEGDIPAEARMKILKSVQEKAQKTGKIYVTTVVDGWIEILWLEMALCEHGKISEKSNFDKLAPEKQLEILEIIRKNAQELHYEKAVVRLSHLERGAKTNIDNNWVEKTLFQEAGVTNRLAFNELDGNKKLEVIHKVKALAATMFSDGKLIDIQAQLQRKIEYVWDDKLRKLDALASDRKVYLESLEKLKESAKSNGLGSSGSFIWSLDKLIDTTLTEISEDAWLKPRIVKDKGTLAWFDSVLAAEAEAKADMDLPYQKHIVRNLGREKSFVSDKLKAEGGSPVLILSGLKTGPLTTAEKSVLAQSANQNHDPYRRRND